MIPKLRILSNVIQRLKTLKSPATGYLYGIMDNNTLTVITFSLNILDEQTDEIHSINLQLNMPTEIDLCGVLQVGDCKNEIPDAFKDIDITDNPLLIKYFFDESDMESYFFVHQKLEIINDVKIITENEILQEFVYIRLQGSMLLMLDDPHGTQGLQELKKTIASGQVGIHFPNSNQYLIGNDDNLKDISLKELFFASIYEGNKNVKTPIKFQRKVFEVIDANVFFKISRPVFSEDQKHRAPVLQHVKRVFNSLELNLKIDTLSLVNQEVNSAKLYAILVESIFRNVKAIEKSLESQLKTENSIKYSPYPVHFRPQCLGHPLTLVHPLELDDIKAKETRKTLHQTLALETTKPYFRQGNSVKFASEIKLGDILINPHESLLQIKENYSIIATVEGLYSYHHYTQNGISDDGWGCAYRSLQTIVSWYRFQGYTDIEVPSHSSIQKCLVEIGDKPSNFIGSKQWIGSTEVGYVLETLLGVTVRILCATNGEEVAMMATNLVDHFQSQGTPIMIGGGVLAHTILGIKYDESSNDTKFLILDPHYTGSENLNTIISKGWCGWKTKNFWRQDAFYNMCLPQRPICI